jgi:hypothetical protein
MALASKVLGYGVVAGATFVKVPQVRSVPLRRVRVFSDVAVQHSFCCGQGSVFVTSHSSRILFA